VVRVRFIIEAIDLDIARASIQRDRFTQCAIRFQPQDTHTRFTSVALEFSEEPRAESKTSRRARDPHALHFGGRLAVKLERAATDGPAAQAGNDQ
jgi:hypothetical protein